MTKLLLPLAFTVLAAYSCFGEEVKDADELALKYCKKEYTYMGSHEFRDSRLVNKKMYLERMLELKDGKLNAHYAKDVINRDISMYEHFLKTKKAWKNSDLTQKQAKEFSDRVRSLKHDLGVIEKSYPADYGVFERARAE